jgi:Spy/CpxP family protein refolding chaperone
MRQTLFTALAASALVAGTATVASAQPAPPSGGDVAQAAAGRADDMTLLLGLRPDQRAALNDYLGAITPPPRGEGDERRGPPDQAAMQARMDATQRFRAGLTPDQQMRFDALERMRHGMGGRRRWGGGQGE